MNCIEFQRWLDDGRPEDSRIAEHAAECVRCEQELHAADEVERLLAVVVPAAVSADFNDVVLRKIRPRGWRKVLVACAQVMAEPIVPVSLALAFVIASQYRMLTMQMMAFFGAMTIARALVIAPLIAWVSWRTFTLTRAAAAGVPTQWSAGVPPALRRQRLQ